MHIKRDGEVTPVEMVPGVVRTTRISSDKLMIVEFRLAAGAEVPEHRHPHEQCGTVRKGRMVLRCGGEETVLGPGDSYHIPGGVQHSVTVLEDAVTIDVFTPPREDYL